MIPRMLIASVVLAFCGLGSSSANAEPSSRWLHVKVTENGEDGEIVRINLPIQLATAVIPAIDNAAFHDGVVRVDSLKHPDVDIRALIKAIREAENGEYVSVDSPDEQIRIRKEDGVLYIDAEELDGEREKVKVKLRMDVLEALLSGQEDELNILAAVQALDHRDQGDLITVLSDDETVRIWVDSSNNSE